MAASSTEAASTEKGSLILEVILAIAVFALIIGSLSTLLAGLQSQTLDVENHRQALYEAASIIGKAMNTETMNEDFLSLLSTATTTVQPNASTTGLSEVVTERLLVRDLTPCKKALTSLVSWYNNFETNATDTIVLSFVVSDPDEDTKRGGDCEGDEPHLSWNAPITNLVSDENIDINTLDASDGILVAVSSSSNPSLLVFQYQKAHVPSQVGSLLLNFPASQVDFADKYVYLAVMSSTSQLKIVSIADPANPTMVSGATLPGVTGSYPNGLSVFYYDSRVYIGTHRTAGREFHIYSVSTPQNPVWLGSIELDHNINQIIVRGKYAYLATSGNTDDIIILDISNPAAIKQVSSLTFAGSEDTESVFLIGTTLYAGRKKGSSAGHPEFYVIDVSNPTSPSVISSFALGNTIASIKVAGNLAYLATDNGAKTLTILDISDPRHISIVVSAGLNAGGTSIDYESDMVFLAASSSLGFFTPAP